MSTPFRRIDTVILRVADLDTAVSWYRAVLAADPLYRDDTERLAVLPVGAGTITLWQRKPDEAVPMTRGRSGTYPIFAVDDVETAHAFASTFTGDIEPLQAGAGVRFFGFRDPDGNYLEACQVLET